MAASKIYYTTFQPEPPLATLTDHSPTADVTAPFIVFCDNPYVDLTTTNHASFEYSTYNHAYESNATPVGDTRFYVSYFNNDVSLTGVITTNYTYTSHGYQCQKDLVLEDYYFSYHKIVQGGMIMPSIGDIIISDSTGRSGTGFPYPSITRTYWTIFGFSSDYQKIYVQNMKW